MGASGVVDAYTIDNSCRFEDGDSPYMTFTPGSAGNRKTFTISFWFKRGNIDAAQHVLCAAASSDKITLYGDYLYADIAGITSDASASARTLLRDPSAWYHLVLAVDTTQSTSTNRIKWYLNGSQMTAMTAAFPSLNADSAFNNNTAQRIGTNPSPGYYYDGYIAEFHMVDGTALDQTSFGETGDYGEWKPIQYTGSHGTNGYHLDFSNSSALGDDAAGSNDFTVTNITASDQVKDSPTNNFAALNPLQKDAQGSNHTYSEGNLKVVEAGGGGYWRESFATFEVPKTGKWYMEFYHVSGYAHIGLMSGSHAVSASDAMQTGHVWYDYDTQQGGTIAYNNSSQTTGGTGANLVYAISVDAGVVKMYKSNVLQHTFSQNLSTAGSNAVMPIVQMYGGATWVANFGQDHTFAGNKSGGANAQDASGLGSFYYSPPSEHKALCSQNLDDPTVIPSEHFGTVIYTGDGGSDRTISTDLSAVDFVWLKIRSGADDHRLANTVTGGNNHVKSNATDAESTGTTIIKSFSGSTFNVGSDGAVNGNSSTYVAWNWKAGGAPTADNSAGVGATPTAGSVKIDGANLGSALAGSLAAKRQSANTTNGFSITWYDGTASEVKTVAHGLSEAPDLVTIKKLNGSGEGWQTGSIHPLASMDFTDALYLHDQIAISDSASWWNDVAPSSTVVTLGGNSWNNASSSDYIMYCFHSVEGYSKVGNYIGNGSTDGTFVYLGFRPAWVLIKAINAGQYWVIFDNKRATSNPMGKFLIANTNDTEQTQDPMMDFLSNGMKMRRNDGYINNSTYSGGYLYYAVAEQPFKHTNAK